MMTIRTRWIPIQACMLLALCGSLILSPAFGQNDISLAKDYPAETLLQVLTPINQWQPYPALDDREAWDAIPEALQTEIVAQAEEYAALDIPILPASVYLQFKRNGNRSNYQDIWYERRVRLAYLVLGECIENKGRFLDPLTDMLWAICEETSWTWPAHIGPQKAGADLPDADDQVVALFSAQTAQSLAIANHLLGEKLKTVSPLVPKRIQNELDRRILTPFMEKQFGWMGYQDRANKRYPNNWNPWICSNVAATALLAEPNPERRAAIVHKVMDCLDNFLTYYPSDGSCDEGPSYWGRAGASLFDALEHLYSASHGRIQYYDHPLIQEIGRFIYRTHIVDHYYICLGDCDAQINIPHDLVYRYGKRIQDDPMLDLATYGVMEESILEMASNSYDINRWLHLLFNSQNLVSRNPAAYPMVRDVWLGNADTQIMAARDRAGSAEGLFLAAWGGHNGQSHNHNDVGNIILFADGKPVVIDIGRPTYTRQTFSSQRYEIWAFQSGYHNLPTINNVDQLPGGHFAARDVNYSHGDAFAQLSMDIAKAYPQEAGIQSWNRTVRLQRDAHALIKDEFVFESAPGQIVENFIIAGKVQARQDGTLILHDGEGHARIEMRFDPDQLEARIETLTIEDGKLRSIWSDTLYRVRLHTKTARQSGTLEIRFTPL